MGQLLKRSVRWVGDCFVAYYYIFSCLFSELLPRVFKELLCYMNDCTILGLPPLPSLTIGKDPECFANSTQLNNENELIHCIQSIANESLLERHHEKELEDQEEDEKSFILSKYSRLFTDDQNRNPLPFSSSLPRFPSSELINDNMEAYYSRFNSPSPLRKQIIDERYNLKAELTPLNFSSSISLDNPLTLDELCDKNLTQLKVSTRSFPNPNSFSAANNNLPSKLSPVKSTKHVFGNSMISSASSMNKFLTNVEDAINAFAVVDINRDNETFQNWLKSKNNAPSPITKSVKNNANLEFKEVSDALSNVEDLVADYMKNETCYKDWLKKKSSGDINIILNML